MVSRKKNKIFHESINTFLKVSQSGIFPLKPTQVKRIKTLTPKKVFQRLPIALTQVKAGNTLKHLLNKIRQIVYSLYRAKEITNYRYKVKWILYL